MGLTIRYGWAGVVIMLLHTLQFSFNTLLLLPHRYVITGQGTLYKLSFYPISIQQNPTIYIPLMIFSAAIILTWLGLRLRRDL